MIDIEEILQKLQIFNKEMEVLFFFIETINDLRFQEQQILYVGDLCQLTCGKLFFFNLRQRQRRFKTTRFRKNSIKLQFYDEYSFLKFSDISTKRIYNS